MNRANRYNKIKAIRQYCDQCLQSNDPAEICITLTYRLTGNCSILRESNSTTRCFATVYTKTRAMTGIGSNRLEALKDAVKEVYKNWSKSNLN